MNVNIDGVRYHAEGDLIGGNIQLHKECGGSKDDEYHYDRNETDGNHNCDNDQGKNNDNNGKDNDHGKNNADHGRDWGSSRISKNWVELLCEPVNIYSMRKRALLIRQHSFFINVWIMQLYVYKCVKDATLFFKYIIP